MPLDIALNSSNGNATTARSFLGASAHYAPACVFGAGVNQWVPVAITYAQALIANGAKADTDTLGHAARVIVNMRERGPAYAGVRAVLSGTESGRALLGQHDMLTTPRSY